MGTVKLWAQTVHLVSHAYFERKSRFEVQSDVYPVWVLFALEAGQFRYRIGEERGVIGPGDLVFCPPGYAFEREMVSTLSLHYIGFEFAETPPVPDDALPPTFKAHPADGKRLASDFAYLRRLGLANDPRHFLRKQAVLNDIWQLACDEWDDETSGGGLAELAESDDMLMNRAAEWLIGRAHTPFSMRELSDLLALSPVQLTRRFQKAFRMPPSELVRLLRIRKAAKLLLDTELNLEQIAERCGYENGFYLSRVFSRSMGTSPSKYRKLNRL
ncbi:AraC family transcriptional regulator [Paenibacillus sp. GYB003]|uniref:AraC family transcriptional regulator n=1 Tax=Paenibacillus sp. GYB003 TaxID=2994392 RepID=UPI002F9656AF